MNIWVPRCKILEPDRELLLPCNRVQGYFKFEAIRPDGRKRLLADWFPNLILNAGLDDIGTHLPGSSTSFMNACRVGTGTAAPAATQTNLVSHVAGTTTKQSDVDTNSGTPPYYGVRSTTYRFAAGVAAGNLAEVGIGTSTSNASNLFSRALILDGGGNPTTLTVLSDEVLDVSYELRNYAPDVDVAGSVVIAGVTYDWTRRASNANTNSWAPPIGAGIPNNAFTAYTGTLGAVTGVPSGTSLGSLSGSNAGYTPGNYYRDHTVSPGLGSWNNVAGIGAIRVSTNLGAFQYGIVPSIPKDNTKTMSLTFRTSWARRP